MPQLPSSRPLCENTAPNQRDVSAASRHLFHESGSKNDILCVPPQPVSTKRIFGPKLAIWFRQNATCVQKPHILQWFRALFHSDSKIISTKSCSDVKNRPAAATMANVAKNNEVMCSMKDSRGSMVLADDCIWLVGVCLMVWI